MSYRFIFDTSVLDEKSVKDLRNAGIVSVCNSGRFAFYMTPVLLKERLHFTAKGRIPQGAIEPVKLLVDLKWQKLFNEPGGPEGIYTQELEGKSRTNYLFIDHRSIKENLKLILDGGEFIDAAKQTIAEDFEQWTSKKNKNRDAYKLMRVDVTKKLQKDKKLSRKDSDFKSFLGLNFESVAVEKIRGSINSVVSKDRLVEYWLKHRARCSYFNKFIEGWLFTVWYFMAVEQEPKIDANAYDDIEHLVYLIGLDGIVSNEKGFIMSACKALYPDKEFLSVEQFVRMLEQKIGDVCIYACS